MFSRRTPQEFALNALARRVQAIRLAKTPLIDLTESNPTRAGFLVPPDLLLRLSDPSGAHYSPDPRGQEGAREAVSSDYASRGSRVDARNVILTASSSESYSLLFKLLANPGDEILVPRPSYPLFEFLAELDALVTIPYTLHFDGEWHLSVDAIAARMNDRTRAVVVVHPNNPTGSFIKAGEASALIDLCARRGIAIIADEVFADFVLQTTPHVVHGTFASESGALCFALGGLSKSCALPQMKLGWIAVSGPDALKMEALARLEFIADNYLSVATPVQLTLPEILERKSALQEPIRARLTRNLAALKKAIANHPELKLLPIEGGWSALLQCPATSTDEERALMALEAGVLVHPGHFFDIDWGCFLVVSLLVTPEAFDAAMAPLVSASVR